MPTITTPRERVATILAREADAKGVLVTDVLGRSRNPAAEAARLRAYRALTIELGWSQGQIARLFGRTQPAISIALRSPAPVETDLSRLEQLEDQIRRLTGVSLAQTISQKLGIAGFEAIFLAMLVEAYPRALGLDAMVELYEEAARVHGFGDEPSHDMVRQFRSRIRKSFYGLGLADPVVRIGHGNRGTGFAPLQLNPEMAVWFAHNFDKPILPSLVAHRLVA